MYNGTGGFFYTGTNADQITIFTGNIPEDVQTWSYLALRNKAYAPSIDWATSNLLTTDTAADPNSALTGDVAIVGETYASASLVSLPANGSDPQAVWLEGTGHTAAALFQRAKDDSLAKAIHDVIIGLGFLRNIGTAQAVLGTNQTVNGKALTAGQGIVAATGNLDTGFGFDYFPKLHIGATGWYVIAARAANPFQLSFGNR